MDSNHVLSLLGLAMRGGRLAVGEEPVEAAARSRDARVLLLASDAAENTRRRVEHFAQAGQCLWIRIPYTKDVFGRSLGRSSVAVAALTDIGLAAAVVHRLAELDPVQYDEVAAKLDLKAQRAAERKTEQLAHEKNLRAGRKRTRTASFPKEPPKPPEQPAHSPSDRPAGSSSERRTAAPRRKTRPGSSASSRPYPSRDNRLQPKSNPYAHSRPVKKGKGSFRKKDG
ncbi:Ribosomal protein L7Ae [Oscillibacter sp. PC13]|uniref:L7Ae/L30e/S12e/Gadd45 family ribosomal protein n=1 Tax=Oscillibacter sp. PC13 TaxID=1855299 RepID=UPI0008F0A55F|nr:hypothetical protein [Oscillibacter sp. PC13]SFP58974.1 Ribosomal protein L7Ae [Oscillibacter sp. PC13]